MRILVVVRILWLYLKLKSDADQLMRIEIAMLFGLQQPVSVSAMVPFDYRQNIERSVEFIRIKIVGQQHTDRGFSRLIR